MTAWQKFSDIRYIHSVDILNQMLVFTKVYPGCESLRRFHCSTHENLHLNVVYVKLVTK